MTAIVALLRAPNDCARYAFLDPDVQDTWILDRFGEYGEGAFSLESLTKVLLSRYIGDAVRFITLGEWPWLDVPSYQIPDACKGHKFRAETWLAALEDVPVLEVPLTTHYLPKWYEPEVTMLSAAEECYGEPEELELSVAIIDRALDEFARKERAAGRGKGLSGRRWKSKHKDIPYCGGPAGAV